LDDQLRRGYEVFDGLILGERERAQTETNANPGGSTGVSASGSGSATGGQPQTLPGGDQEGVGRQGQVVSAPTSSSPSGSAETFSPPDDIPSGRDDDVVARQIREAAMQEPDPELREALWEEYRNYTGISEQ